MIVTSIDTAVPRFYQDYIKNKCRFIKADLEKIDILNETKEKFLKKNLSF